MIDTETARIMGRAFTLGYAFGQGMRQSDTAAAADCGFAQDEARWITVHPNGEGEGKGRPALIDSESGVVLGGMGGKFTGKKITEARSTKSGIKSARKSATSEKLKAQSRARADLEKAKASEASKKAGQESKPPKENTSAKMYERAASRKKEKMNSLNEQLNGVKTRIDKLFQDQEAECRKDPEASKWMDRREKKWNEIQEMQADLKRKFPNGRPDESDRDGTAYWNNTESFIESAWKDHDAAHRHFNEAAAPIHEKYNKKYSDLIKERKGVESELEHQQKLLHQLHQRYTRRARQLGEEDFDE